LASDDASGSNAPAPYRYTRSFFSLTEGNMGDKVKIAEVKSTYGRTLDFFLFYNSYLADGSKGSVITVLGKGWTHSYNILLFKQRRDMFLMSSKGRTIRFTRKRDGSYAPGKGHFQTLIRNPDGTFTMKTKDATHYNFARISPVPPYFVFGIPYVLTGITDRNGNATTLTYNDGLLAKIKDTFGREIKLTYNSDNKIETITDPLGRTTRIEYTGVESFQLTKITDALNHAIEYTYNVSSQIVQKKDKSGNIFTYQYNSDRKPVSIKDGNGRTLFSLTNTSNWDVDVLDLLRKQARTYIPSTTTLTDGKGDKWQYEYDENGYLIRVIAPSGDVTHYAYDPAMLNVTSYQDPNGKITRYEYDTNGNMTKMTDALGHDTRYTYELLFHNLTSMTDANDHVTAWQCDSRGNNIRETDCLGRTREWTYDANGNVLTEKDKRGNVHTHEHDSFGNRIKTTDPLNITRFTYDTVGNLTSRTDGNNHTTFFEYDGMNRLIKRTEPLGGVTDYAYDGNGNTIKVTDSTGHVTAFQYDYLDRLLKITDALNHETAYTYDGNDNRTSVTDQNGNITTLEYDAQNRLVKMTDALSNGVSRTYDKFGNVLSITDANGNITTVTYDALNRVVTQRDPEGAITRYEYDLVGSPGCPACSGTLGTSLVTKQIDDNGKVIYFKYDAFGQVLKVVRKEGDIADTIDPTDAVTEYAYDACGNMLSVKEPNGNTIIYTYDGLDRRIKETNAAGDNRQITYNSVGNILSVAIPNGNVITSTYDDNDRLIRLEDSVGLIATYTYDLVGNRRTETDGNGNTKTYAYDAINRVVKVTDPLGEETKHEYDAAGNLIKTTDRNGKETTQVHNATNRLISVTDALGHTTQFKYDGVGNLMETIDAKGNATHYEYNGCNQMVRETFADGGIRTFTYDALGNLLTRTDQKGQTTLYNYNDLYLLSQRDYPTDADENFTYDKSGRLLTAEKGGWLVTFQYDPGNRVIRTTQGSPLHIEKTMGYVYDIPGRTRTVTYPGGRVITEQMDVRDRLNSIDDRDGLTPIAQYAYDLADRVTTRTYRNGTTSTYAYNRNNWTTELEHSFNGMPIAGFRHEYDREGNKLFEENRHDTSRSEAYQHDDSYRLINYKVGELVAATVPVPVTQTAYNLDKLGNWDSRVTDGVTEARTHNEVNEIIDIDGVPLLYDENGNLVEDKRYVYAYNEENRLVRVTRKADSRVVAQYKYDALGRRVIKITDPSGIAITTYCFCDNWRVIEEEDDTAVTQATYVYGNYIDEVLTMDRGGQTYYYHHNTLWSVATVTDAAANVMERYAYDAYGSVTITDGSGTPLPLNAWGTPHSAIGNPYSFTGRRLDEETGIYHYRARYYDPVKGRFVNRDPISHGEVNLYLYVNGRPVLFTDPMGLKPFGKCKTSPFKFDPKKYIEAAAPGLAKKFPNIDLSREECKKCCPDCTIKDKITITLSVSVDLPTLALPPIPTPVPGLSVKLSGKLAGGGSGSAEYDECTRIVAASGYLFICASLRGQLGFHAVVVEAAVYGQIEACVKGTLTARSCPGKVCLVIWGTGKGTIGLYVEVLWWSYDYEILNASFTTRKDKIALI